MYHTFECECVRAIAPELFPGIRIQNLGGRTKGLLHISEVIINPPNLITNNKGFCLEVMLLGKTQSVIQVVEGEFIFTSFRKDFAHINKKCHIFSEMRFAQVVVACSIEQYHGFVEPAFLKKYDRLKMPDVIQ